MQINEDIRDREVRVVTDGGEQLGIMSAKEALKKAEERNLDLVKISPNAKPPVCKIMDYGKYRFEQSKREKENRKNQRVIEIKEIRLSLNIDTHDFETKVNHAHKFLKAGNKVKVSIRFRGREMAHPQIGEVSMKRFAEACEEFATVEKDRGASDADVPCAQGVTVKNIRRNFAMPKIKTHSGAKKRFKLSKNGKPIRAHANKSHILTKKNTKRKRNLRKTSVADTTNVKQIKRLIPYK